MSIADKVLQLKQDFDDVYEAGKQAGGGSSDDSKFWDMITDCGNKTTYPYAFYYCRLADSNGNILFTPKRDIRPTTAGSMFEGAKGSIDLQAQFEKEGKVLDFSNCTAINRCFYLSEIERIGVLDVTRSQNISALLGFCKNLYKVDEIVFSKDITYNVANMFLGCESLTDITASGELATSGLNLSDCPLTRTSKLSFLNILEPTTTTKTITFGAGETLTNEDVAIGTQKGWSVVV